MTHEHTHPKSINVRSELLRIQANTGEEKRWVHLHYNVTKLQNHARL